MAPSPMAQTREAPKAKAPKSTATTPAAASAPPPATTPPSATTPAPTTTPPRAAPPIAASPIATSPAAPDTLGGVDELRARWPEVVAVLSENPPIKPLIEACRPISVEGHLVTLGFPEDKAFLKIALERRGPILEEGIGRILGRAVNVRCVATNLEHVPTVSIEAESADLISEARRIFADDLVDVGEVS
jgi:hypothetical protein